MHQAEPSGSRNAQLYMEKKIGTYVVDHEVHDGLGHEVPDGLVDDADVRVHQVADGLHLALQLWIHGHRVPGNHGVLVLVLRDTRSGHDVIHAEETFLESQTRVSACSVPENSTGNI